MTQRMLSKLYTATLLGLDCKIVEVEVDYRKGTNFFTIVGLADKSIQEAKDRIPSAIKNSGFSFVVMQIIMNLAPAELIKSGTHYDLPLALGYLIASEQLEMETNKRLFIGELALDGRLRPVNGILPIVDAAKKLGFEEVYLPIDNANEASIIEGIKVLGAETLSQVVDHLQDFKKIEPYVNHEPEFAYKLNQLDFCEVKGQKYAKRALEIAAAGGHNILLSGTPGSGKTLLSKCLPSILPSMTSDEKIEVTRIYSVAGLTSKNTPLIIARPFRSPHHTSSQVALVGGGSFPKPGEISLAHRGVLFLDEFPEFSSKALESLRQPLEDKIVTISRANGTLTFPANFMLVAAMNPCKCGFSGDPSKECICTTQEIVKYQKKISGPILDRIDLQIKVVKVEHKDLVNFQKDEASADIKNRVEAARSIQLERYKEFNYLCNSDIGLNEVTKCIVMDTKAKEILALASQRMNLSARSYFRIIKVSRTIADLELADVVREDHVAEALSYRIDS